MHRSASPGEELQTKHSFIQLLPFTPPTRDGCLTSTYNWKTSLFPPIIESNAEGKGGGGKTSKYYTHWHLVKYAEQLLSKRDGLISGQPMPTQTTVLASFHCQHLRFQLNFSTLQRQFLFPLFFPHMISPCPRSYSVFHRLQSQSSKVFW